MPRFIKSIVLYSLAILLPLAAIWAYEAYQWSNDEVIQEQLKREATERLTREREAQIAARQLEDESIEAQRRAAREKLAAEELDRLQQMLAEQEQAERLRCVISGADQQCRCFDLQNAVVEVGDSQCRELSTEH